MEAKPMQREVRGKLMRGTRFCWWFLRDDMRFINLSQVISEFKDERIKITIERVR